MLRSNLNQQNAYELICIEELVPSDHLLQDRPTHFILADENPARVDIELLQSEAGASAPYFTLTR